MSNRSKLTYSTSGSYITVVSQPGDVLTDHNSGRIVTDDGNGGWIQHATSAELTTVSHAVSAKADAAATSAALGTKANVTDVTTSLAGKADTTALTAGLALKADAAAMTTALASKANSGDVTTSLLAKSDRYPTQPFTAMLAAFDRVYNNLTLRFVYPSGNFLWPGVRAQTNLCHQADTTSPPTAQPDLWAMATIHTPFYERWKLAQDQADTATASSVATMISNNWNYVQQKWSLSDLKALTVGTAIGWMDDGCHVLKYLKQVIEVTGDATAKAVIQEALAALLTSFLDPRQTGSDLYTYANVTPDGRSLKWNQWGVLYPPPNDKATQASTGYVSTIYEAKVSHVAGWLSQQSWVSAAYQAALLAYAKNRADFYYNTMRTGAPTTPAKAVQGIHWATLNLDPNIHSAVDMTFNNGNPVEGSYNGVNVYHQPRDQAFYDRPYRGLTAHFPDGTYEIGCTNYWVWKAGGGASYLAEFESILQAVTSDHGYARDYHGVRVFGVFRDAWIDGQALGDLTRCCRASVKAGNTTTDPIGYFRQVVVNTARSIVARSADGYLDADWMGRQYSPAPGRYTSTWIEDTGYNYAGPNGSGFGHPRQLTTNGCAGTVVGAAAGLAADHDPALSRSGVSGNYTIETLAADVAALTAAQETSASLFGGQLFADPFKIKLMNTGFHHDGYSFYVMGDTPITRFGFNRSSGAWEGTVGGTTVISCSTNATTVLNNLTVLNNGVSAFANSYGGQLYLGTPGGLPGLSLGIAGTYINASVLNGAGHISLVANNTEGLRIDAGNVTVYGAVTAGYHYQFSQDNVFNFASPSNRAAGIYLGNQPNVTSDATTKTEVTPFSPEELAAARAIAKILTKYKNKKAVADKGDSARWHSGVIAQAVIQELQTRNLIPAPSAGDLATDLPYDWVGHDSWDAIPAQEAVVAVPEISHLEDIVLGDGTLLLDADGKPRQQLIITQHGVPGRPAIPGVEAGSLYTVRYEALLVWIAAAHEQAISDLETSQTNLENNYQDLLKRVVALESR